jgi:hypothetical protein
MHGWGSNFMVAIALIHMVQVFLFGAHKFPRELTWIIGVFLLLMTLGMAFTGQVLRFDQDAYWGLGIGASIASRVPVMGPYVANGVRGTSMPAFAQSAGGMLTEQQIEAITNGIFSRWGRKQILDGANPPSYAAKAAGNVVRNEEYGAFAAVAEAYFTGHPVAVCGTAGADSER